MRLGWRWVRNPYAILAQAKAYGFLSLTMCTCCHCPKFGSVDSTRCDGMMLPWRPLPVDASHRYAWWWCFGGSRSAERRRISRQDVCFIGDGGLTSHGCNGGSCSFIEKYGLFGGKARAAVVRLVVLLVQRRCWLRWAPGRWIRWVRQKVTPDQWWKLQPLPGALALASDIRWNIVST